MGFWTGIKHALNSTLGTADFKPLNEIVTDLNTWEIAPNDNTLYNLYPQSCKLHTSSSNVTYGDSIIINANGTTYLSVDFSSSQDNSNLYSDIQVLKNGKVVASVKFSSSIAGTKGVKSSGIFEVNKGDVISLQGVSNGFISSAGVTISNMRLCGSIVPPSIFKVN